MRLRILALLVLTTPAHAQSFCTQIKSLTQDPSVAQAHWGISITTLDGTSLCAINAAQLFRPASNAKLFTAAAALALLGPTHTFSTTIVAEATTPSSDPATLDGNLRILGDGDPFLTTRPVPYAFGAKEDSGPDPLAALADTIAATGLRRITGEIIGVDSAWPIEPFAPDWAIDDAPFGYGAPVSSLSVYDNKLKLTVSPGATLGSPATATFDPPISFAGVDFYKVDLRVRTVAAKSPAAVQVERLPCSDHLRIFGTVALGAPYTEDLAISDPADFAALTLKSMLQSRGIQVDGHATALIRRSSTPYSFERQEKEPIPHLAEVTPRMLTLTVCEGCRILATHTSPSLLDDVTITLKVSQNLHAELLLHHLGEAFAAAGLTADGSTAEGARVIRQFALNAGLSPTDFLLFDGSGLSGHDLVAPRAFTQLLAYAARQPWFPGFKAALPVGGTDGSLDNRFTGPLKGRVFAKTGTLGESRALSGYLTADSGKTLIFSIMVDNHLPTASPDRALIDQIVTLTATHN